MENRLSGLGRRAIALLFDTTIGMLVALILTSIAGLFIPMDSSTMIFILIVTVLLAFVYVFGSPAFFGNSLGKYLMRIKVVNEFDSKRPSGKQCLVRGLFMIIWPVEVFVILFSRSKQRIGDMTAGTLVVSDDNNRRFWLNRFIFIFLIIIPLYIVVTYSMGFASRNTDMYRVSIAYMEKTKLGELEYGSPLKLNYLPRAVMMNKSFGSVVFSGHWPERDGFITIYLQKEAGNWRIKGVKVTEKSPHRAYSFSY